MSAEMPPKRQVKFADDAKAKQLREGDAFSSAQSDHELDEEEYQEEKAHKRMGRGTLLRRLKQATATAAAVAYSATSHSTKPVATEEAAAAPTSIIGRQSFRSIRALAKKKAELQKKAEADAETARAQQTTDLHSETAKKLLKAVPSFRAALGQRPPEDDDEEEEEKRPEPPTVSPERSSPVLRAKAAPDSSRPALAVVTSSDPSARPMVMPIQKPAPVNIEGSPRPRSVQFATTNSSRNVAGSSGSEAPPSPKPEMVASGSSRFAKNLSVNTATDSPKGLQPQLSGSGANWARMSSESPKPGKVPQSPSLRWARSSNGEIVRDSSSGGGDSPLAARPKSVRNLLGLASDEGGAPGSPSSALTRARSVRSMLGKIGSKLVGGEDDKKDEVVEEVIQLTGDREARTSIRVKSNKRDGTFEASGFSVKGDIDESEYLSDD